MSILKVTMLVSTLFMGLLNNAIADLSEGLIAYYPFDGNANDESGNRHDGTENGGVTYVVGKYGYSASLNGTNSWIFIDDMAHLSNNDFTISMWLKYPDQTGGTHHYASIFIQSTIFVYPYEGVTIFIDRDVGDVAEFRISATDPVQSISSGLNDNEWKHFSFVKSGSQLSIYIDGVFDSTGLITTFNIASTSPIFIGANHQIQTSQNYEGLIDDLRMYNRALSDSEIEDLYFQEISPIDGDGDGIPDVRDNFPLTKAGSECNEDANGDIEISHRIFQGTHSCIATNDIKTGLGVVIKDGAAVTFDAGRSIYLHTGLLAEKGADFKAAQ